MKNLTTVTQLIISAISLLVTVLTGGAYLNFWRSTDDDNICKQFKQNSDVNVLAKASQLSGS